MTDSDMTDLMRGRKLDCLLAKWLVSKMMVVGEVEGVAETI